MSEITLDVRSLAPRERHPRIFSTFQTMPIGSSLILVNDHDPRPLYYQFAAEHPGTFEWNYLDQGPDVWRVDILKTAEIEATDGSCCGGGCGG